MNMHTASEIISYVNKVETETAVFYEEMSKRLFLEDKNIFLDFSKENKSNIYRVNGVYYGIISDALEGCFTFDLDPDKYTVEVPLPENAGYNQALNTAARMEENIIRLYVDAAEQSKPLIGDITRAFLDVAKKRSMRLEKLTKLSKEAGLKTEK
jgi:rubrerythrin